MSGAETRTLDGKEAPAATRPEVPSWRLVATLALAGGLAAFALSFVYEATRPAIEANKAKVLEEAVGNVLKNPARVVSLRVTARGLEPDPEVVYRPEKDVERVFFGFASDGTPIGFALVGAAYGYGSDPIKLIFGYDAASGEILGLQVLEHKETPGIGTEIEDDATFAGLFWKTDGAGKPPPRQVPLEGMRDDQFDPGDPHHIDMISGATISSRAVIKIVNDAVGALGDRLKAWRPGEAQ